MTVRIVTQHEALRSLESDWSALAGGMPFRSWTWLATWWKYYGAGNSIGDGSRDRQLSVLAVYSDSTNRLVGLAPWYLDRSIVRGNTLRWLGSGEVCTDHLSLICRPQHSMEVAEAIAETLTTELDDWDQLDLRAVDADDVVVSALLHQLEARECIVSRQPADSCWVLELPLSWADYLASLSKSHRKQLRQLERRVLTSGRVRWHRIESADALTQAWPIFIDLHQRRRRALGEPGCFASPTFHDFHFDVVNQLLRCGQLRMSFMELDGSPAAAEYHLADGATTYAYQGGIDPDRLEGEPGRLSTILCLQAAIEEGQRQFDFLRGDEPYKAHWRATSRLTFDYRVIPNRRLARLRGRVQILTHSMTDWMRQQARILAD